ncbi:MAG: SDR family oxidoreductase [candidate division Zixibacteria bacterium]|nr:SDR family oxidoreductase [candidate division Zixibacteria bacterium]
MKKISELMSLKNRCAIVTGGAGHVGLTICETLMELGATVSVFDLHKNACDERCADLNSRGYRGIAIPMPVDLLEEDRTRQAVIDSADKMGEINIIVHAAAFVGTTEFPGWTVPFEEQSVEAWDAAIRVNLTSAFLLVQAAKPYLEKSGNASVIFIGSIYGLVGPDMSLYEGTKMANPAAYAASKGGLIQLTRYLATLLAPKIRVNNITAGGVLRGQPKSFQERYIEKTPLRRMATEEDFKGTIAYLVSDLSSYTTGTNLVVDGGWTAW